jgi:serine/threonine protein kinase
MSPEQEQVFEAIRTGQPVPLPVDGRSDLYSLGLVLHEMLAGCLPERRETALPLESVNSLVSPCLSSMIGRCLAPNPKNRYPDARALAADLRRFLQSGKEWRAQGPEEPSMPYFPWRRCECG